MSTQSPNMTAFPFDGSVLRQDETQFADPMIGKVLAERKDRRYAEKFQTSWSFDLG